MIIWKRTSASDNWGVYHRDHTGYLLLDRDSAGESTVVIDNITDTSFRIKYDYGFINEGSNTYVGYLFAHDEQDFGTGSDESIIKCGSFDGTANTDVNLGWEPQWVMFKNTTSAGNWQIVDMMRGFVNYSPDQQLMANLSNAESSNQLASPTATGFTWMPSASGNTYIYIAIRKPMKIPESGSEVFGYQEWTGNDVNGRKITLSGVDRTDLFIHKRSDANAGPFWANRHLGRGSTTSGLYGQLNSSSTNPDDTGSVYFDTHNGVILETTNQTNGSPDPFLGLGFKRARGFMDIVPWTGDGSSSRNINHNLGVAPELIIAKRRDAAQAWPVYVESLGVGATSGLRLNTSDGTDYSNSSRFPSTPTSSVFTIGNDSNVNTSSGRYVAYLFATLAGVSKVGSVTVSGSTNVDCGFASTARFIMLKRADGVGVTGDWFVFYKVVSGNDTYFRFNISGAKVTTSNFVGTYSSGFTVESGFTNGDYIFLAIA
jgi:hypothetical protein